MLGAWYTTLNIRQGNRNMKKQKIINLLFAALVVMVFSYFILGECFLPSNHLDDTSVCEEYSGKWERVTATGEREQVELPGKCEADRNELVVMETTLPDDIENGRYLCFRSGK